MTAKEILRRYSQNLKRVAMLEYDLKSIDNRVPIKVTDCSQDQGGSGGGGLEDMYWDRIEKKKLIEMELEVIKWIVNTKLNNFFKGILTIFNWG